MFSKQTVFMDKVRDITVENFLLKDSRTVDKVLRLEVGWKSLQEELDIRRPGTVLCGSDMTAQNEYMNQFLKWEQKNPGKTTDDFDLIYDPKWDDSQCDPRLGTFNLIVFEKRRPVGLLNLYNIKTESDTKRKQVVSAMVAPSLNTERGKLHATDVKILLKGLLEQDMAFESGKIFDIIEWRFPTREKHSWAVDGKLWSPVQELIDDGFSSNVETKDRQLIPKSIRRV